MIKMGRAQRHKEEGGGVRFFGLAQPLQSMSWFTITCLVAEPVNFGPWLGTFLPDIYFGKC